MRLIRTIGGEPDERTTLERDGVVDNCALADVLDEAFGQRIGAIPRRHLKQPQERELLTGLFDRLKQVERNPKDEEAEAFIAQAMAAQPSAPYFMAQVLLVQDQALSAAQARIRQLQQEIEAARSQPAAPARSFLGDAPAMGPWGAQPVSSTRSEHLQPLVKRASYGLRVTLRVGSDNGLDFAASFASLSRQYRMPSVRRFGAPVGTSPSVLLVAAGRRVWHGVPDRRLDVTFAAKGRSIDPIRQPVLLITLLVVALAPGVLAASTSSLVVDGDGRTLQALDADQAHYPASLTKMMTLYLLFEAMDRGKLSAGSRMRVSRWAAAQPPTKLGLLPGRTIMVRDAILAVATQSANDVAVVIAEALAGSEDRFALRMTATAHRLGMARTTFRNASGLHHPQQKTTARDMAVLGRALLCDFPRHYSTFATRAFRYGSARYGNHNRLLGAYRGMDGIKTGYTDQAGFNLVASAERNGRRIIGVVMASPSAATRNARMVALLDEGFRAALKGYVVKSGVSGRHVARATSMSRLAAKRSHHGAIAVASRTVWRKAEAKRKTASTHPQHAEAMRGWFRVAQASPQSGKSGTLKGNPGQAHAALGLR